MYLKFTMISKTLYSVYNAKIKFQSKIEYLPSIQIGLCPTKNHYLYFTLLAVIDLS